MEMNVAKQPARRVWIGDENSGIWQKVEYEAWPMFCNFCEKIGHLEKECFKKDPSLLPLKETVGGPSQSQKQVYVAKEKTPRFLEVELSRNIYHMICACQQ